MSGSESLALNQAYAQFRELILKVSPNEREEFLAGLADDIPTILKDTGVERNKEMESQVVVMLNFNFEGLVIDLLRLIRTLEGIAQEVGSICWKNDVKNESIDAIDTRFEFAANRLQRMYVTLEAEYEEDYGAGSFRNYVLALEEKNDDSEDDIEDWEPHDGR